MELIEIWKPVVGYETYFHISNFGRLKSIRQNKEKILKQCITKLGICTVATRIGGRNGKSLCFKIHRLVAESHLAPPSQYIIDDCNKSVYKKVIVNHIDGNKQNNHVDNLEWCTQKENTIHAYKNNLSTIPSQGLNRKLSDDNVRDIRKIFISNDKVYGISALARKYEVTKTIIHNVVYNIYYKDVK